MDFLRKCQEWMVVNLTKPIQGGQEEEQKVTTDHDSTERLLRGESRDTLTSFENSDEDAKLLRSKSIENLKSIDEKMSSTGESEDIGREALSNPGMILWHPPSAEFKITMSIKRGYFPVKYRVKRCPDSQEYYFLVEGLDEKSSLVKKLGIGDWLQSVKGDESVMVALSNESAKEKLEHLIRTSKSLTIIFQRPKSVWTQRRDRRVSSQNGEVQFNDLSSNYSLPPQMAYYDSISCCEDGRSEDVNHLDIDLSMGSRSMGSRSDRMSVNNMLRDEMSESGDSFQFGQLAGQTKPRGFYKNSKVHPASPSVDDCDVFPRLAADNPSKASTDFKGSIGKRDKSPMYKNGVSPSLPSTKVKPCIVRYRKGHRRVHSDGSVRNFNSNPTKISPANRRSSDSCSLMSMTSDNNNQWGKGDKLKTQVASAKTYVVDKVVECFHHLAGEYLTKVPVINIPIIYKDSRDMKHAEQIISNIVGMDKDSTTSTLSKTFCTSPTEMVPFSKTVCKLKKGKWPDSVYKELSECAVDQLIMAKHCASNLRAYSAVLNNLETISGLLLQDDSEVNGIPLKLIGYFLSNPPIPHGHFVKVELKPISEDELMYAGIEFTSHSISCIFINIQEILSNPADYLVSLSNKINFIQSYAGEKAPLMLYATNDASADNIKKVGRYLTELLQDKFQQGLVWNHATGLPLFCVDLLQSVPKPKVDAKRSQWNDSKVLKTVLQNMVCMQDFLHKHPMPAYPLAAVAMSMNLQSLCRNSGIVTSSLTQLRELATDLFGKEHSQQLSETLKALHQSRIIVYHNEVLTKTILNPILDMFVLLHPPWIRECAKQLTKGDQYRCTQDLLVAQIPSKQLQKVMEETYLDSHERLAFLEVFHVIRHVKSDKKMNSYMMPLSIPTSNLPNGASSVYKSDRTLIMDCHGYLPLPACLPLLCLICEQFEGDTSFLSPLAAVFSGRAFDFQIELCPWKAFGIISVRLKGKKPLIFFEFFHNLMLSVSRKQAALGLTYDIGPLCPLIPVGKCAVVCGAPDSLHVISLQDPRQSLHCGDTDLMAYTSVVEWFRGLVQVHPYDSKKSEAADPPVDTPLCTIELGTLLLHLPSELFSLICQELQVKHRWKMLAGNMSLSQHDVDLLTIHDNPPSHLFHQWSYSTDSRHGPSTLGRLFHFFAVGIKDQFGDVKTRIKDWIEENGYVLMSSSSNHCSSKLHDNALNMI